MNRAAAHNAQEGPGGSREPLFSNVAGKPDARFIYESIDAANSLLSILNSFIDPVAGLKCMPLKYCLYVIYAAVFLFKVGGGYCREEGRKAKEPKEEEEEADGKGVYTLLPLYAC